MCVISGAIWIYDRPRGCPEDLHIDLTLWESS